jgi:ADP-heptose:LPS heptosyltransferase
MIGIWRRATPLKPSDFPAGAPLYHFCAWSQAARRLDRRYVLAGDIQTLLREFGGGEQARELCVTHLARRPLILARLGGRVLLSRAAHSPADFSDNRANAAAAAARQLIDRLDAAIGCADDAAHAAVFAAFEALAEEVDLRALAGMRPRHAPARRPAGARRVLLIRLSALGDFVQSLGPMAALRHHHAADHLGLLTTAPFAAFATALGLFDEVLIDRRPKPAAFREWWGLRRQLHQGRFDRVYDLHTSQRSSHYLRLFPRRGRPEWSGIAPGCSHPHANLDRDRQHTIDKQSEQLLMAGINPIPRPTPPPSTRELPAGLAGRNIVLLVPGSSPHRLAKRWPAGSYGRLALALSDAGYLPVIVGTAAERALALEIRQACSDAIDLTGHTDLLDLAALTREAHLTVGNDTGVCHLAAAAGGPVVVLFSAASDPALCAPRGNLVLVLAMPDLNDLDVDAVLAEALALLHGAAHRAEVQPA